MNASTTLSKSDLSLVGGLEKIIETKWDILDRASLSWSKGCSPSGEGRGLWVVNAAGGSQVPCNLLISTGGKLKEGDIPVWNPLR
jgi:hypothetical protein